ncbi:MAG: DUF2141 domain-containing protein [Gammaproteobacteria bacterium]|nr:DUF2141 domain-containing protein [Gammaproteobacteria bacterium]
MKMKLWSSLFVLLMELPAFAQGLGLVIEVVNIGTLHGTIRACLTTDKKDFLSRCSVSEQQVVNRNTMLIEFGNLNTGTYCVSLYHDIDNNGKLNSDGLFGMPSEPYGFSNNPGNRFGPPPFRKCTFELVTDLTIRIKL